MSAPKRYAILVGVSQYQDKDELRSLPYARNDVLRLRSVLTAKAAFPQDTTYVLADASDQSANSPDDAPTRANILHKLQFVCDAAQPDDLILFYFAGHGAEISTVPYLLAADSKMNVLDKTAVNVRDINEMLGKAKAKCLVRLFDACRSAFGEGRRALGQMTAGFETALLAKASGWATFSSCSSGEVAHDWEEMEQGLFTYYVCEGLAGKAANTEGKVTLESLVDYVKTSVSNWCDRQTLIQTPHFQSDISGSLVFGASTVAPIDHPNALPDPFNGLRIGIENHLSRVASDTRRLTFTSVDECKAISATVLNSLKEHLARLSLPALSANIIARVGPLHQFDILAWQEFQSRMNALGVVSEFTNNHVVFQIDFHSNEVVVPSTVLHIVVVQFKFFYWIWYRHACPQNQLQGAFAADPPTASGFFTFKPVAAKDRLKIDRCLSELFSRASDQVITWAGQLGTYVESRAASLRKTGPIIE